MKKILVLISVALLLVVVVSSCSSETCPAYSVNDQENIEINS